MRLSGALDENPIFVIVARTLVTLSKPFVTTNSPLYFEPPRRSSTNRDAAGSPETSLAGSTPVRPGPDRSTDQLARTLPARRRPRRSRLRVHRPRIVGSPSAGKTRGAPNSTSAPITAGPSLLRSPTVRRYESVTAISST